MNRENPSRRNAAMNLLGDWPNSVLKAREKSDNAVKPQLIATPDIGCAPWYRSVRACVNRKR